VRKWRFVPGFLWQTWRSFWRARRALRNQAVRIRRSEGLTFWTVTTWDDEPAMSDFGIARPHLDAMPKLLEWCDEASVAHWTQCSPEPPEWERAEQQMAEIGRLSKVNHPSPRQLTGQLDFVCPRAT